MTSYLIDTYSAPSTAQLQMPGCVGASRYISHTSGKNVTGLQVKTIHSLGKWVQLNFEDSAGNAKGGLSQGGADAQFVLAQLHLLSAPKGVAVYFSVDFEVHTSQPEMATVLDYFRPIKAALHAAGYLVGAYGNADVIAALFAAGLVDFGWQTVAWSYGKRDPHAVELQDTFTNAYDKDELLAPYIGAWLPSGAQPKPAPPVQEFTVDAEAKARFDAVDKEIADLKASIITQIRQEFGFDANGDGHADFTGNDQGILAAGLRPLAADLAAIKAKLGA